MNELDNQLARLTRELLTCRKHIEKIHDKIASLTVEIEEEERRLSRGKQASALTANPTSKKWIDLINTRHHLKHEELVELHWHVSDFEAAIEEVKLEQKLREYELVFEAGPWC